MYLIDAHAHLSHERFAKDRDKILDGLDKDDIVYLVEVGYDLDSSKNAIDLSSKYDLIYSAVGIHPHDVKDANDTTLQSIEGLASAHRKVVAIGEIGLDFYRMLSPREKQKVYFEKQIEIALRQDLPIMLHVRDAYDDVYECVKPYISQGLKGIVHSFSSDEKMAEKFLDLGFFISFSGQITYPRAENIRNAVKVVPVDRLLIETDSPYLPPQPVRGKRNEPRYVRYVLEEIARIKGIPINTLADGVVKNFEAFFQPRLESRALKNTHLL